MVKRFYTPSDGMYYYAWGYVSSDGMFYRTRPFRSSYDRALADAPQH